MRVVLIHRGPSDTCPCEICHPDVALHSEASVVFKEDSMVTTKCDQGRSRPYGEDGAPEGTAIGGLLAAVAILALVIGAGLIVGKVIGWMS